MSFTFAGYPAPFVYEKPRSKKWVKHLLWGDYVRRLGEEDDGWVKVRARNADGWMREEDVIDADLKPLEMNFVDIGQGDGCFIVTPDDKFILIDAGEEDNMFRFLSWRFNLRRHPEHKIKLDAIISHSDQDHYGGMKYLFECDQIEFGCIYHNGIVERAGDDLFGPVSKKNGNKYVTEICRDKQSILRILDDPALVGRKKYPSMLKKALADGRVDDIRMLSSLDRFLPGYDDAQGSLCFQVLGPVPEKIGRKVCLRYFEDDGKTKNGHSILLRAVIGDVSILLGGDLNTHSEEYLLAHYTGGAFDASNPDDCSRVCAAAHATFRSDIVKACHHGSSDFTELFLRAVDPIATIISSGDDEPYAHPRPDALGAFGKCGRGRRPLLFSTELGRSSRENIRHPNALRRQFRDLLAARDQAKTKGTAAAVDAHIEKLLNAFERSVSIYGLVNLRTDGTRVLLAQRLEKGAPRGDWDVHLLERDDESRELHLVSRRAR